MRGESRRGYHRRHHQVQVGGVSFTISLAVAHTEEALDGEVVQPEHREEAGGRRRRRVRERGGKRRGGGGELVNKQMPAI